MQTVILVRHAHTDWVVDEARPLSAEGYRDAERLVPLLVETAPTAIYSSPYARARQTMEPTAAAMGFPIEELSGFRERKLADGAVPDFAAALVSSWKDFDFAFPNGESSAAAQERIVYAFEDLVGREDEVAMVGTHGNVLALLFNHFDPSYHYEFWHSLTWPDVFRLSVESGEIREIARLWEPV